MKRWYNVFLILFFGLFMVESCNKDISLSPITFTTTSQTNAAELNNQLAGLYSPLEAEQLYGWGLWGYFESGNDEGFSTSDATGTVTQSLTASFRSSSQDATYMNFWKNLYSGVERANVILSVINQPVMDSVSRANIKGQALFLRAYYFYLLVNNFGDVPYKTQLTSSLGTNFNIPATPSKAIYDSIIQDMTTADSLVQSISKAQTTSVVTKSAVEGILARVCLAAAGSPINGGLPYYQKALYWSEKLINSGVHSLYSSSHPYFPSTPAYARVFINNMQDNYNDNNLTEDMWDAAFLSNGAGSNTSLGYTATQQLGAILGVTSASASSKCTGVYRPFPTLYNLYGNGDLRRDWVMSPYILDANNNKFFNLGVTVKIAAGYTKTIVDTVIVRGVPKIVYDTTYYGSGATATATVDPVTGSVTAINITNGGSGYSSNPAPTASLTGPSAGKNFKFGTITVDPTTGSITSIAIANAGTGYITIYDRPVAKWRREYEINFTKNPSYTSCNFPIIRYADVLLMAAEADIQVRGGGTNATSIGIGYYNQVKRRAYGFAPNVSSAVDVSVVTMDSIKAERSRELCFEGVRRNDLKRWGITNWVNTLTNLNSQLGIYNLTSPGSSTILTASQIAINNFLSNPQKYSLFPIPASELAVESAIYQNQGW